MMDDYTNNWMLAEAEEWLNSRPVCDICGLPIQENYMFEVDNEQICPYCIEGWLRQFKVMIGD